MTERTAWLTMAKAYETDPDERTRIQSNLAEWGVCAAINCLYYDEKVIDPYLHDQMQLVCGIDVKALGYGAYRAIFGIFFCSPLGSENDSLRADYCRFQYYRLGGMEDE